MLKPACNYVSQLQELMKETIYEDKYKYYHEGYFNESELKISEGTWNGHTYVSVDKDNNVLGYIKYGISRPIYSAHGLTIVNFTDNKLTFGKDVYKAITDIFLKYNLNKLNFGVFVGNPIEKTYDKLVHKYNGRIVGVRKNDVMLSDGKLYDFKMYELLREEFLDKHMEG